MPLTHIKCVIRLNKENINVLQIKCYIKMNLFHNSNNDNSEHVITSLWNLIKLIKLKLLTLKLNLIVKVKIVKS